MGIVDIQFREKEEWQTDTRGCMNKVRFIVKVHVMTKVKTTSEDKNNQRRNQSQSESENENFIYLESCDCFRSACLTHCLHSLTDPVEDKKK